jgi:hypothetical protein
MGMAGEGRRSFEERRIMSIGPPLGYITNPKPETNRDLVSLRVADKAVSVTKSAIQGFINSFVDPNGANRNYATSVLSPQAVQFVTNLTYDDEMKTDPNQRKLYLSRFLASNTGRLPAVLIIDAGIQYVDLGLNDLTDANYVNGRWQARFLFFIKVSLSIVVATMSEEDTDTLGTFLMLMFGPLANLINNYQIQEPGQSWIVRLPLTMTPGQSSSTPIEGDTKSVVWTRPLDLVVDFETIIGIDQADVNIALPPEAVVGGLDIPPNFLNFEPNQAIQLGSPYPLMIERLQADHVLAVSDPNVALVSSEPPFAIIPRRQGRALLYVFKRFGVAVDPDNQDKNGRLVMDIPFRVTA